MPNINITVAAKIATNTTPGEVIVCGNSDYTVTFAFDSEWDAETERTARFVYYKDGLSLYQDVEFTGTTVAVPTLYGVAYVLVGVYAGDLHTTTPAKVLCDRSILCGDPLEVLTPEEKAKLQAQIGDLSQLQTSEQSSLVAAINEAAQSGGSGLSQALRVAIYNLLMDAVYQSTGHESDKAALAELLTGGDSGSGDDTGETEATLSSISATYTGGDVSVGTAVSSLTGIVVTAHYSDGSTETVTGYTLSGEIVEESNTITVAYGGKITTITVNGVAESVEENLNPIVTGNCTIQTSAITEGATPSSVYLLYSAERYCGVFALENGKTYEITGAASYNASYPYPPFIIVDASWDKVLPTSGNISITDKTMYVPVVPTDHADKYALTAEYTATADCYAVAWSVSENGYSVIQK